MGRYKRAVALLCLGLLAQICVRAQVWLDPEFGIGGVVEAPFCPFSDQANGVAVQSDGKILVAGAADLHVGQQVGADFLLARFSSNGILDASFGLNGLATHEVVGDNGLSDIATQEDGKIVVAGWSRNTSTLLVKRIVLRFNANGTIDTSFGVGGVFTIDNDYGHHGLNGVALQADGKIVVVGYSGGPFDEGRYYVARINSNGTFDNTFAGGAGAFDHGVMGSTCWASKVAISADGAIISVGGSVTYLDTAPYSIRAGAIIRYQPDGTLDPTFGENGIALVNEGDDIDVVTDVALETDGKVLITGSSYSDGAWLAVTNRLLMDGIRDPDFGIGGRVVHRSGLDYTEASGIAVDGSGHILVGGTYRESTNVYHGFLCRLLDDGYARPCVRVQWPIALFGGKPGGDSRIGSAVAWEDDYRRCEQSTF